MRLDRGSQPYDSTYREFDSALMRRIRSEAYGEDIGQHSWVTAGQLREDVGRLRLAPSSRLLDLGCGPGGPLSFVLGAVGCQGTGLDLSRAAIDVARQRAASLGVDHLATLEQADLDCRLPLERGSFEAVMALDVVLHVRDRAALFREVARVLTPRGRFLFTDAGVLVGAVSSEEVASRSLHGHTQLVASGVNERALAAAGLQVLETEDRTASLLASATLRLAARLAHRAKLEKVETPPGFESQQRYLGTVVALARRPALARILYLAELND
jgi:SAM-dependent methyltransferase